MVGASFNEQSSANKEVKDPRCPVKSSTAAVRTVLLATPAEISSPSPEQSRVRPDRSFLLVSYASQRGMARQCRYGGPTPTLGSAIQGRQVCCRFSVVGT